MRFGIIFANTAWYTKPQPAAEMAAGAEQVGVESLWTVEHVVVPAGYESTYPYDPSGKMPGNRDDADIPDPLIWLAYVAAKTTTIRLGTGILILPQRNPLIVAKEVATLDSLSGGRMELGVGVGWLEEEFTALGVPFADRGRRLDDYVAAMRALWTGEAATHVGTHTNFERCYSKPVPVQATVPIVIGGHTEVAARRAGRLGNGFFPGNGDLELLTHLFDVTRRTAEEHGRDPAAIELTAGAVTRGAALHRQVEQLAALGVTRVLLPPPRPGDWSTFEDLVAHHR